MLVVVVVVEWWLGEGMGSKSPKWEQAVTVAQHEVSGFVTTFRLDYGFDSCFPWVFGRYLIVVLVGANFVRHLTPSFPSMHVICHV